MTAGIAAVNDRRNFQYTNARPDTKLNYYKKKINSQKGRGGKEEGKTFNSFRVLPYNLSASHWMQAQALKHRPAGGM
jgi:hypothetical protein